MQIEILVSAVLMSMGSVSAVAQAPSEQNWRESPAWTKDLIIYEVGTKGFTSPGGAGSGGFKSLESRLGYLENLGITALWVTEFSLSDADHHSGVIDPSLIDPTLGTADDFKALVDAAHHRNIKVILNVITHGVSVSSPLVRQHPEWFRAGTYGMLDYDWQGGHPDLDDWWVKTWSEVVKNYGVDGFFLDVGIFRPDLWARIRRNASAVDHPIVIWEEDDAVIPGVTDFSEFDNPIVLEEFEGYKNELLINNMPKVFSLKFGREGTYRVDISYSDGTRDTGDSSGQGPLRVRLDGLSADKVSRRFSDPAGPDEFSKEPARIEIVPRADGLPDVRLTVDNVASRGIEKIRVTEKYGMWPWVSAGFSGAARYERPLSMEGRPFDLPGDTAVSSGTVQLYLSTLSHGFASVILGYSLSKVDSPGATYVAHGSRAFMGYSLLFAPAIPIFTAGEEFDAQSRSPLSWNDLNDSKHQLMLNDVSRMLSIRKTERALLGVHLASNVEPNLKAVVYKSDIDVPVPYIRWDDNAAIIILGNRNTHADAHMTLDIPMSELGALQNEKFRVTDIWNAGSSRILSGDNLSAYKIVVKKDNSPRGGIGLVKIERLR